MVDKGEWVGNVHPRLKIKRESMKMKFARKLLGMFVVILGIGALNGCGNDKNKDLSVPASESIENEKAETENITVEDTEEKEEIENIKEENVEGQDDTSIENTEELFSFVDISNHEFYFSSGAGGWCTVMYVHEDGTFEGNYHDSDMGDIGEGYPNGVMYYCDFNGKFTKPHRVNAYTYSIKIENINVEYEPGTEEIRDGICYRYSEPYGLDSADEIYIYLPETPVEELPEGYKSWVYYGIPEESDSLSFYGLYNVTPEYGFSGYEIEASYDVEKELERLEAEAKIINDKLQSGTLAQMELNQLSGELYNLWDDALNDIWGRLKETLDEEEMKALTQEEREWIAKKEKEVQASGAECEGGSLQPLIENDTAAELTRKRVYELAELLK